MNISRIGFFVSFLAVSTVAQTAVVRGEVDEFPGSRTRFLLEDTRVELVSNAVDLRALEERGYYEFTVEEVAGAPSPTLTVLAATPTAETFGFDRLQIGATTVFEVNGRAGAFGQVFLQATDATGFLPLGSLGSWLLGVEALPVGRATIRGDGEGELSLTIPNVPELIGTRITGQAAIVDGSTVRFTNPDSQVVVAG